MWSYPDVPLEPACKLRAMLAAWLAGFRDLADGWTWEPRIQRNPMKCLLLMVAPHDRIDVRGGNFRGVHVQRVATQRMRLAGGRLSRGTVDRDVTVAVCHANSGTSVCPVLVFLSWLGD